MSFKSFIKNLLFPELDRQLNNQFERDDFILQQLSALPSGLKILDAGCGSQRYRKMCGHLEYFAQDFGKYTVDEKRIIGSDGVGGSGGYRYGRLDYVSDITDIPEEDEAFDAVLCTEVLEHIPRPNEAIAELSRLLKPGGCLILTAPSNCLRHMDPYFYYSGFSDRWFEEVLSRNGLAITMLSPVGDYYSWLAVEMARTASTHSVFAKIALSPAFLFLISRKKTKLSIDTLAMGYHCVARKL